MTNLTAKPAQSMTEVDKKTQPSVAKLIRQIAGHIPSTPTSIIDVPLRKGNAADVRYRHAKAMYSYSPDNEDELRLEKDDLIEVLGEEEEGWWRGRILQRSPDNKVSPPSTHPTSEGVFPSNFVKLVIDDCNSSATVMVPEKRSSESKRRSSETESNQIQPQQREIIQPKKIHGVGFGNIFAGENKIELRKAGGGTQIGESKKIDVVSRDSVASKILNGRKVPESVSKEYAKVAYPYESENEDELTLKEGEIVVIISRSTEDPGWWRGEANGKEGVFPDNFVELITTEEAEKLKKLIASTPYTAAPPSVPLKPTTTTASRIITGAGGVRQTPPGASMTGVDAAVLANKATPPERPPPPDQHVKPSVAKLVAAGNASSHAATTLVSSTATIDLSKEQRLVSPPAPQTEMEKTDLTTTMTTTILKPGTPKKAFAPSPMTSLANVLNKPSGRQEEKVQQKSIEEKEKDAVASLDAERLTHPTALRPRNPNKRPPSTAFLKDISPNAAFPPTDLTDSTFSSTNNLLTTSTNVQFRNQPTKLKDSTIDEINNVTNFVSRQEFELLKSEFTTFKHDCLQRIAQLESLLATVSKNTYSK